MKTGRKIFNFFSGEGSLTKILIIYFLLMALGFILDGHKTKQNETVTTFKTQEK